MNFEVTNELLEVLKPYTEKSTISISTNPKDWIDRRYQSDFVSIDEKNDVGFYASANEIIVFYFGDHYHFEDYSSELQEGQDDYIKRAKEFLVELFENRLKHVETYKGKKLASDKYYIVYPDNKEECVGNIWYGLVRLLNPFAKKTEKTTIWRFEKSQGCFIKLYSPMQGWEDIVEGMYGKELDCFANEVVEVIYSEDKTMRYVITKNDHGSYSYCLEAMYLFNEEELRYTGIAKGEPPAMWEPYPDVNYGAYSSYFATKEIAVREMKDEPYYKQYF